MRSITILFKSVDMRFFALFGALVAVLAPASANATQPLATFVERGRTYSTAARESTAVRRQREAESDVALGRLVPGFSARGVYTRNQYEVEIQLPGAPDSIVITPQNQLDAFLQLDVPIIDLASYYRYKSSSAVARASGEQGAATLLEVDRAVAFAYYNYLGSAGLEASARASVAAAEANLRNVEARVGAGAGTDFDRQRAIANVEQAKQEVADAELRSALAAHSLQSLTGLSPTPVEATPADDLQVEAPLQSWLTKVEHTPQDRAARALSDATHYGKKAADAALLPTLTGTAQERLTNAAGFSGHTASYTLQLTLGWRLDYGSIAQARAQSAAVEAQQVRLEGSRRNLADAIFEAHRRIEAGIAKSRAARAQSAAASRAAELAQDRYSAGMVTQLEVIQAQREASSADAARIRADADLSYSRAALRLAAAVPISGPRSP